MRNPLPRTAVAALFLLTGCQTPVFNWGSGHQEAVTNRDVRAPDDQRANQGRGSHAESGGHARGAAPPEVAKSNSLEEAIQQADFAFQSQQYAKAENLYRRVLQIQPNHFAANHQLGVLADIRQDFQTAETHYRTAIQVQPNDANLLSDLGYSYLLQGRYAESEKYLHSALQQVPTHPQALNNLGLLYFKIGSPSQSLEMFRRATPGDDAAAQAKLAKLMAKQPSAPPIGSGTSPSNDQLALAPNPFETNTAASGFDSPAANAAPSNEAVSEPTRRLKEMMQRARMQGAAPQDQPATLADQGFGQQPQQPPAGFAPSQNPASQNSTMPDARLAAGFNTAQQPGQNYQDSFVNDPTQLRQANIPDSAINSVLSSIDSNESRTYGANDPNQQFAPNNNSAGRGMSPPPAEFAAQPIITPRSPGMADRSAGQPTMNSGFAGQPGQQMAQGQQAFGGNPSESSLEVWPGNSQQPSPQSGSGVSLASNVQYEQARNSGTVSSDWNGSHLQTPPASNNVQQADFTTQAPANGRFVTQAGASGYGENIRAAAYIGMSTGFDQVLPSSALNARSSQEAAAVAYPPANSQASAPMGADPFAIQNQNGAAGQMTRSNNNTNYGNESQQAAFAGQQPVYRQVPRDSAPLPVNQSFNRSPQPQSAQQQMMPQYPAAGGNSVRQTGAPPSDWPAANMQPGQQPVDGSQPGLGFQTESQRYQQEINQHQQDYNSTRQQLQTERQAAPASVPTWPAMQQTPPSGQQPFAGTAQAPAASPSANFRRSFGQ